MSVDNLSVASATSSKNGVVIIGAGLAGWHVIDVIRAKDAEIPITLITADSGDRYHKPMLTMAISQNKRASDLVRASGTDAAKTAGSTNGTRCFVGQSTHDTKDGTHDHSNAPCNTTNQ